MTAVQKKRPAQRSGGGLWSAVKWTIAIGAAGALSGVFLLIFVFAYIYQQLPSIDVLTDYRPKVPLRVWSAEGRLIGEFGEERRDFVRIADVPKHVKDAILCAEDDGFYEHHGIELMGIARAAIVNVLTGRRGQGGSTITMQVARNFFLTTEPHTPASSTKLRCRSKLKTSLRRIRFLKST